jgi:hypothetical protein
MTGSNEGILAADGLREAFRNLNCRFAAVKQCREFSLNENIFHYLTPTGEWEIIAPGFLASVEVVTATARSGQARLLNGFECNEAQVAGLHRGHRRDGVHRSRRHP